MKNKPFRQRVGFALAGIAEGWRRERSFRTHGVSAISALGMLGLLRPAPIRWTVIIVVIALVLAAELVNAAREDLVDHLHPEIHPRIRVVKAMAAGAVLITALASLAVAGLPAADLL